MPTRGPSTPGSSSIAARSTSNAVGEFYLDENVAEEMVPALRRLGHDAVSTAQLGNKGATDVQQLLLAGRMGRVLITHNFRHFALLHEAWLAFAAEWGVPAAPRHPGILIIPDAGVVPSADAARAIDQLIASSGSVAGRLLAWKPATGWREVPV